MWPKRLPYFLRFFLYLTLIICNVKIKRIWPYAKIRKLIKILWILGEYNSRDVLKHVTLYKSWTSDKGEKVKLTSISSVKLESRFLASSESTLNRNRISSATEFADVTGTMLLSLGGGGKLDSSSKAGAEGLDTADPPPSTPLLTDGVFSESLHSSSSPEKILKIN